MTSTAITSAISMFSKTSRFIPRAFQTAFSNAAASAASWACSRHKMASPTLAMYQRPPTKSEP